MGRVACVILATLLAGCRSQSTSGTAPASDSEHRGIAIAPVKSEAPTIEAPIGSMRAHGLAGNSTPPRCHMLDGTEVSSCAPGDSLCKCDDTSLTEEDIRKLMDQLRDGGRKIR